MPRSEAQLSSRKKSQEKARTRGERKNVKTCRHTNKAKVRVNKNQAAGRSSRRRVSASWGWSFHGHRAREPGRAGGSGCPSPRLPVCLLRAGGQRRAASCEHRPARPLLRVPPTGRGRVTSTAERRQQHLSSSLLLRLAARPPVAPRCLPPLPTPAPLPPLARSSASRTGRQPGPLEDRPEVAA